MESTENRTMSDRALRQGKPERKSVGLRETMVRMGGF